MFRAPDKFKPFKPCLKKIHILADNLRLKNAKIYKNLSVSVSKCMSVCLSQVTLITFCCLNHGYLENNKFAYIYYKVRSIR